MARRILSIDWDGIEARFAFGFVQKDRLIVLKAGAASIVDAAETVAQVAISETASDSNAEDATNSTTDDGGDASAIETKNAENAAETVERSDSPTTPPDDFDEDDAEESSASNVVSVVKKSKKGESFKTSPLAKTLKKLLRERRVGAATVVYSAERGDVDVLVATIPQASDAETPELVFNQTLRDSLTFNETQPLDYLPIGATSNKRSGTRRVVAVSATRENLRRVRETLIGAVRAPSKIGLREPALAEFLRGGFCGLTFAEPVVLVQELCDEVNLTLCDGADILYFRSFKIAPEADSAARAERIREEIVRTIAVGTDDLPEDAVVSKALYFTDETKTLPNDETETEQTADNPNRSNGAPNDESDSNVADASNETEPAPGVGILLTRLLEEEGISLEFANPFRLPGVKMKSEEPENPGRFASLLGTILAERPQSVPAIDLLHPRQKPKAPNYGIYVLAYCFVVGIAFAAVYFWNKSDLKRIEGELAELEKSRDAVAVEMNSKRPLFSVLSNANAWQNRQGVVVLDELRDIMLRIPKAPDLVVTRLAYLQNGSNGQGGPTFIISAKITSIEVYQQFRAALASDNSHRVTSQRGPVANVGGGGYRYLFDANIVCARRPSAAYNVKLPQELRAISENEPERFAEIRLEEAAELKRRQEEAQKQAAAAREAEQKRLEEERQKQAEAQKQQEEAAGQAQANATNGEAPQNQQNQPTPPNSQAIKQRLTQERQPLDARLQQAQEALDQSQIDQAKFNEIQAEYQKNLKPLVDLWNEITNYDSFMTARQAAFQRSEINQEQWNQLLTEYRNRVAQVAQKCDQLFAPSAPIPQPETPAPAPEQPVPAPQPEAPAPKPEQPAPAPQPEAPAPTPEQPAPAPEQPAPSASLDRSQTVETEV